MNSDAGTKQLPKPPLRQAPKPATRPAAVKWIPKPASPHRDQCPKPAARAATRPPGPGTSYASRASTTGAPCPYRSPKHVLAPPRQAPSPAAVTRVWVPKHAAPSSPNRAAPRPAQRPRKTPEKPRRGALRWIPKTAPPASNRSAETSSKGAAGPTTKWVSKTAGRPPRVEPHLGHATEGAWRFARNLNEAYATCRNRPMFLTQCRDRVSGITFDEFFDRGSRVLELHWARPCAHTRVMIDAPEPNIWNQKLRYNADFPESEHDLIYLISNDDGEFVVFRETATKAYIVLEDMKSPQRVYDIRDILSPRRFVPIKSAHKLA